MEGKVGSLIETYDNWVKNVIEKQLEKQLESYTLGRECNDKG